MGFDQALQRAALVATVGGLAVEGKHDRQRGADALLDNVGEFDERHFQMLCQQLAQAAFAGTTQTHQCNAVAPAFLLKGAAQQVLCFHQFGRRQARQKLAQQGEFGRLLRADPDDLFQRHGHGLGHLAQAQDRDIALPAFELRQVTQGDARVARQDGAGHAAAHAQIAHMLAQGTQVVTVTFCQSGCLGGFGIGAVHV